MRNIKKEYKKYVISYFIVYILLNILWVFFNNNLINIDVIKSIKENEYFIKPIYSLIIIPMISILALVIMNILPSKLKEIIIYWRIKERLPSYRWQTKLINEDSKLNSKILNKKYGRNISAQKQQDVWYKAYQNLKKDEAILESQKEYLFARDLCISTVLIIPIIVIIYILGNIYIDIEFSFLIINMAILLTVYLILNIVTRNSANRFVCNVLAIDSTN